MYSTYKEQIDKIIKETEKKALDPKNSKNMIAPVAMLKLMVLSISRYVEKEAKENASFNEALSLEWKSATRMLKFIWKKAQELAIPGNYMGVSGSGCCVPDDIVFDWVNMYYFADDKKAFEEEKAAEAKKKAEAEAKKKAEAEKLEKARAKALEKLSKEDGWDALSDEEKEKKIKAEADLIKNRLGTKKKATTSKKEDAIDKSLDKTEEVCKTMADKSEHIAEETSDAVRKEVTEEIKDKPEVNEEAATALKAAEDSDGQFTLFDLM